MTLTPPKHQYLPPPASGPLDGEGPGGPLSEAINLATSWGMRWAFFGSFVSPILWGATTVVLQVAFQARENFFVSSVVGGAIGGVVGAVGGTIQGILVSQGIVRERRETVGKVLGSLLGLMIVIGLEFLLSGFGALFGLLIWIWVVLLRER